MNDEEMANLMLTLCHQTDKMMYAYIEKLEHKFVTEGGIKERMYAARTGYRQQQDERLAELEKLVPQLQEQLAEAQAAYQDLKQRALKAYHEQQAEIERLKKLLDPISNINLEVVPKSDDICVDTSGEMV